MTEESKEKRPDWMTSVAVVNTDDYLFGRKIDKTFKLANEEKRNREKKARDELVKSDRLRLVGDPVLELERRKKALKLEIINNPIKLKLLRDRLIQMDRDNGDSMSDTRRQEKVKGQTSMGPSTKPSSSRNFEHSYGHRRHDSRDDESRGRRADYRRHRHDLFDDRKLQRDSSPSSSSSTSSSSSNYNNRHKSRREHHREHTHDAKRRESHHRRQGHKRDRDEYSDHSNKDSRRYTSHHRRD